MRKSGLLCVLLVLSLLLGCSDNKKTVNTDNQNIEITEVGEQYIAEVVEFNAETFDGATTDDISYPNNSYLPVGTVDYCAVSSIKNTETEKEYRLLRCGKRTYEGAVKVYAGSLPTSNAITVESFTRSGKYTVLSLSTEFKAPFFVEFKDENLKKESNLKLSSNKISYIDITFCYCNEFIDDFTIENNPLFESYEVIKNQDNTLLRLKLKNIGAFYGWYAEYDEEDLLNFYFLEPTRIYSVDNKYGYSIADAVIVVDAGHGGVDSGAVGGKLKESSSNLGFATVLKRKLEEAGAEVIMTRDDDTDPGAQGRILKAFHAKPDMVISVHRNSGTSNGFGAYYYNSFTFDAATEIYKATKSTPLYRTYHSPDFHYFFLSRISFCPSVLTENGFISDQQDRNNMTDLLHMEECAEAIVRGVINFYINAPNYEGW